MKRLYVIFGIILVAVWIMLMAMLVSEQLAEFRPVQLEKQFLRTTIEARQEWSGIYLKGSKIGYCRSELKRIEDGYQISEEMYMDLTVMDMPQRIETRINAIADSDMRLQMFSFKLISGAMGMTVSGTLQGTSMRLHIDSAGKREWRTLTLKEPPVLTNSLRYFVLRKGIKPGITYRDVFFDPLTMSNRSMQVQIFDKEKVEIHGANYECYKIQTSFEGIKISSWVNEHGETLREESPMGLVLLRETHDQALGQGWGARPDITAISSIKISTPFSVNGLSFLKLRLKNVSLEGFSLHGGRQRVTGDIIAIQREHVNPAASPQVPAVDPSLRPFLEPTPFIQSDNPILQTFVKMQIGQEKNSYNIVQKLNGWVYKNIQKQPTLSIPNALSVFETKQGDCNEHAVLLVALCRAAGVPARVAAGLVYLNGSFYYHAWIEAWIGSWVTADPALNQFPADVSHIKFVEGDMESQIRILRLIGKLAIDVMEYL